MNIVVPPTQWLSPDSLERLIQPLDGGHTDRPQHCKEDCSKALVSAEMRRRCSDITPRRRGFGTRSQRRNRFGAACSSSRPPDATILVFLGGRGGGLIL